MGFLGLTKDTKGLFNLKVKCLIWLEELEKKKKRERRNYNEKRGRVGETKGKCLKVNQISKYFRHLANNC